MKNLKNIWIKSIVVSVAALVSGLSTACFGQRPIEFQHLSINEGLSQSIVFCITQDQDGYMWFGTEDGLNRYDGYEFTIFRNEQGDTNSVSNNGFVSNFVDSKGLVWLGTYGGGLNRLDPKTGTITRFRPRGPGTKTSKGLGLGATFMFAIYEDTTGILWIGAHNNLNRYDPATESFVHYRHNPKDPASAPGGATRSVLEDKNGNLWLGSQGKIGLSRFDRDT
ncbi:MAG: hypothetical protein JKY18_12525, partial [Flavobacteriales bacterium]|nr:hypothetical protein [Flavobacteriales bacterium]